MSRSTTFEVSKDVNGRFRAVDSASGAAGEGDSVPEALVAFARDLAELREDVDVLTEAMATALASSGVDCSPEAAEFLERSRAVRDRLETEGVTDEDVDEAIEWARSQ
jgi:hypothetical protein